MSKLWRSVLALSVFALAIGVSAQELTRNQRAEIRFLEGMMDHHQMALDMAQHCIERAESAELVTLCEAIIEAQSAEIVQMQAWLLEWYNVDYAPMPMYDMITGEGDMSGMDHSSMGMANTDPTMMMGMMAGLNRYRGVTYDIAWIESMIDHHDDALHMSERLLPRVVNAPLGELAQAIIDAQTAEIAMMEAMLLELGG